MSLIETLKQIISEFDLLNHTFYLAWSRGELSKETLQLYAQEYYHQVQSFPRFISRVHTHCPKIEARQLLTENLADEEIKGKHHPSLWVQFGEGLGVDFQKTSDEPVLKETQAMVDTYYQLAERDWRDGLCALFAYEYQVPAVSISKIAGLKEFYGIQDEKTLEFFNVHQTYDVEHAEQVASLIEQYADPEQAKVATREAARALWQFLDGMCHASGITCQ